MIATEVRRHPVRFADADAREVHLGVLREKDVTLSGMGMCRSYRVIVDARRART